MYRKVGCRQCVVSDVLANLFLCIRMYLCVCMYVCVSVCVSVPVNQSACGHTLITLQSYL